MSSPVPPATPDTVDPGRGNGVTESCTIVVFGASGDLTQRMVMPAIFRLARRGLLPPEFRLIGYARTRLTDDEFRALMRQAAVREPREGDEAAWSDFAGRLSYIAAEYDRGDLQGYGELARRLEQHGSGAGAGARRLFYLATPPALFAPIMNHLSDAKLAGTAYQRAAGGWARFVVEKPFGHDLASARSLNAELARNYDENDVYRIDHFLGKEIVQNLFALRFANAIFEPVWNRTYVDHVQITAGETLGVEGRGGYYETAGALRDMVQNHLMQLCALVAIEPPSEWNPRAVRDEKVKVLRAVRTISPGDVGSSAVRGQYGAGFIAGEPVSAYREEEKVAADSYVETYAALRLHIDNMRWAGVPFYLRSGKRLPKRATEIVVEFRPAPHTPFLPGGAGGSGVRPNKLVATISPHEGVVLQVEGKLAGQDMQLRRIDLDYCYTRDRKAAESPSAYEHLLLDALRGDPTFFARADEVEAAWEIVQPVIAKWAAERATDFPNYAAASAGPLAADKLLARDGRRWHSPEE
ncbi:MAG: glucose-6-phosphate dehydrogenase [Gemmatimonadaceae bacterium]|nr:glucose-6-phosphate dehydrogenase [Gemmatimonadaceae bacterium]